ncbi:hypothetical protein ACR72M_13370 [Xenorhabdus bovienii]
MNIAQYGVFLLIIVLTTLRTLALKKVAERVSPENTAFIKGKLSEQMLFSFVAVIAILLMFMERL